LILIRADAGGRHILACLGAFAEHDLVAGLAQPRFIATQAGDDPADIGDEAAAQPQHIGTARVLLGHGALRQGCAGAEGESDQRYANQSKCDSCPAP
jgi:hypothetical protein